MKTMERADSETIRKVNGKPPNAEGFISKCDIGALQRLAAIQSNQWHFSHIKAEEPSDRKVLNQNPQAISQKGPVALTSRAGDVPMYLRKKMRKDPQVALGLAAIKAPIMAAFDSIRVICKDPVIRGFVQQVLMNENGGILRSAVYSALNSVDFGFVAHEIVWQNNVSVEFQMEPDGSGEPVTKKIPNSTIIKYIYDLDPEFTEVYVDGRSGDYLGIKYGYEGLGSDGGILPAEKTWLVTHNMEFGDLLGNPSLDRIYNSWYWCDIQYLFCNRYFERKASPPIKGRAPASIQDEDGNTKTGVEVFANMLQSLTSEGIIVLPSEMQQEGNRYGTPAWDVEYLLDDKRGEMFIKYIEHLQTLKLRGLWIPEMTVERGADAGTFGMAKAHADFFIEMLSLILEEVLKHINTFLIPQLVTHNFGQDAPPCTIDTLTKIGERRDLLEQLLIEVIRAESRVGGLDTARVIDIISLLRQLNINVTPRRDTPDYDEQVDQENKIIAIQAKSAQQAAAGGGVDSSLKEKPDATPKVSPNTGKQTPTTPKVGSVAKASLEDELKVLLFEKSAIEKQLVDQRLEMNEKLVKLEGMILGLGQQPSKEPIPVQAPNVSLNIQEGAIQNTSQVEVQPPTIEKVVAEKAEIGSANFEAGTLNVNTEKVKLETQHLQNDVSVSQVNVSVDKVEANSATAKIGKVDIEASIEKVEANSAEVNIGEAKVEKVEVEVEVKPEITLKQGTRKTTTQTEVTRMPSGEITGSKSESVEEDE